MTETASRRGGVRASILLQAMALLSIILLAQYATAADESSRMAMLRGRVNHDSGNRYSAIPTFHRSGYSVDESEEYSDPATHEPHPADELLQSQDADGSQSYILGGY